MRRARAEAPSPASQLLARGVAARLAGLGIGSLAGIATTSLAVRTLGASRYGVLAFGLSVASVAALAARLGLEPAITRLVAARSANGERGAVAGLAGEALGAVALTAPLATAATALAVLARGFGAPAGDRLVVAASLAPVVAGVAVAAVAASFARGLGRMALMETPLAVHAVVRLAAVAAAAALGAGTLRGLAVAYGIGGVAAGLAGALLVRRLVGRAAWRPSLRAARTLAPTAAPFAVTALAALAISRLDVVVLGLTAPRLDIGRYEPTVRLVEAVLMLPLLPFMAAYLPAATALWTRGERRELLRLYSGASKLAYAAAVPAAILFAVFPATTLRSVYGSRFAVDPAVVRILVAGYVVNLASGLAQSTLAATGDRRALARVGVLAFLSMTLLAAALVPAFGARGAAAATALSLLVLNVATTTALVRAWRLHPLRRDTALTVGSSALPLAAAVSLGRATGAQSLPAALAVSLGASAAWVLVLLLARALTIRELTDLVPRPA